MADLAKSIRFRKVFFDVAGLQFTDWGLQQERLRSIGSGEVVETMKTEKLIVE